MKKSIFIVSMMMLTAASIFAQQKVFSKLTGSYLGQKPPGTIPEIFAPGIVSTNEFIEMGFTCTADGNEIYFARTDTSSHKNQVYIWGVQAKNGKWNSPVIAEFSGVYRDFSPFITVDGKNLLFYRMSSESHQTKRGTYLVQKKGDTWSSPTYFFHGYCMTTVDFNSFFYTTERNEFTGKDLAMVQLKNGKFTSSEKMKGDINSDEWEAHGCISPDSSYLIFDRKKYSYVSFLQKDNLWSKGYQLPGKFHAPFISREGQYLFFESKGDIYWVDTKVIEELKKEVLR